MNNKFLRVLFLITSILILVYVVNEKIIKKRIEKENAPDQALLALCPPTRNDSEGPGYIKGVPYTGQLSPSNSVGDKLIITGKATLTDCRTPIADITLDIWHAGSNGEYDTTWFRGRVKTDEDGRYQFETFLPGPETSVIVLELPHIHFKVFEGQKELLTSRMYFRETNDIGRSQFVDIKKQDQVLKGTFNIIVSP